MNMAYGVIFLLVLSSCSLLPKGGGRAPDCTDYKSLHPKNEALCLVKNTITKKSNTSIRSIVKKYESMGLQTSDEYTVLFVGGGGKGEQIKWTYLVGVNYYDLKTFRSILVVVNTFASGPPRIKEVVQGKSIEAWIK
ncbi:MAG: hypothetical protein ACRBBP_08295 [Bdellovibrionales bacterium]